MVEVEIHEVFEQALATIHDSFPTLRHNLLSDFERYACSSGTEVPDYFGRDSIYTHPVVAMRAKLRHIHISLPPETFNPQINQADRKVPVGAPDQDAALLYVQHEFFEHRFLIVAFLYPDAHGQARQEKLMRHLGYIAQEFQDT